MTAALGWLVFMTTAPRVPAAGDDFTRYYVSARVLCAGGDPYAGGIVEEGRRLGLTMRPHVLREANPPPLLLATTWLCLLPPPPASAIWRALSAVALAVTLVLLAHLLPGRADMAWRYALAATLVFAPWVFEHFRYGQLQLLVLALLVGSWAALLRRRSGLGGTLWGLAIMVKLFPAALLPLLVLRRQWRALGAAALATACGFGLSAAFLGWGRLDSFLASVSGEVLKAGFLGAEANCSLVGYARVAAAGVAGGGRVVGLVAAAAAAGAVLALAVWATWRAGRGGDAGASALLWGAWLGALVLVSPTAWYHYLVLLLPGLMAQVLWFRERGIRAAPVLATLLAAGYLTAALPGAVLAVAHHLGPGAVVLVRRRLLVSVLVVVVAGTMLAVRAAGQVRPG